MIRLIMRLTKLSSWSRWQPSMWTM